jgi:RNA polymerase sigma-70 factor, ECF subfamily
MPLDDDRDRAEALETVRRRVLAWLARALPVSDAEDLAQDVLVLLMTKYTLTPVTELLPLAIGVAWKLRAARWRKARRRGEDTAVDPSGLALSVAEPDPEDRASTRELTARMLGGIRRLGGRCRELMRLKLEERTFPEIAEILGAKLNTVYSWDHRCMGRLRELLGGDGEVRT